MVSKACSFRLQYIVVTKIFLGIPVNIATVYFSGTKEISPWLGLLSVEFLKFKVRRLT